MVHGIVAEDEPQVNLIGLGNETVDPVVLWVEF